MVELQLRCFQCGTLVTLGGSVSFNQTCEKCQTYLHSCGNCKFYVRGQCTEPEARATPDPGQRNTCDWYMPRPVEDAKAPSAPKPEDARTKLAQLFGDAPPKPEKPRNPFGD
ncbi:MAG: hypothetical protein ACREJ2_05680 [Planctomycetota bacterium]